jgi:hypothetical protein
MLMRAEDVLNSYHLCTPLNRITRKGISLFRNLLQANSAADLLDRLGLTRTVRDRRITYSVPVLIA